MGARQGDMTLAVNTLLMTFFTLFSYVMDGFAFAGEALSGKCFGARDTQGLGEVLNRLLLRWGLSLSLVFTVAYVFGGGALVGLLTDDIAVRKAVVDYEMWVWLLPIAGFAAFVYDGIFIGITATSGMLLSSFASSIAFFLILGVTFMCKMPENHPVMVNHLLWLAFIVYLASRGLMQHLLIRRMGILNGKTRAEKHKCAEN